jgi:hypothetical protein
VCSTSLEGLRRSYSSKQSRDGSGNAWLVQQQEDDGMAAPWRSGRAAAGMATTGPLFVTPRRTRRCLTTFVRAASTMMSGEIHAAAFPILRREADVWHQSGDRSA